MMAPLGKSSANVLEKHKILSGKIFATLENFYWNVLCSLNVSEDALELRSLLKYVNTGTHLGKFSGDISEGHRTFSGENLEIFYHGYFSHFE